MTDETDQLEAQNEQRAESRRATFEAMASKRRAEREVSVVLNEGDEPVSFLFRAISAPQYDRLVTANPPTKDQLADGAAYNINTFGPALLAKVIAEPAMTVEQWKEIWNSDDWSGGEISGLFSTSMELCSRGLNLAPTAAG
jgi:hypothetical protein